LSLNFSTNKSEAAPDARPAWHRIYYILALFDVLAISTSLYLNHRLMQMYVGSLETNRVWVDTLRQVADLGELGAILDAPGNDVFHSLDVPAESRKLQHARENFDQGVALLRASLQRHARPERAGPMLEDLKTIQMTASQLLREARLTFEFIAARQIDRANLHMASMDRWHSTIHTALGRLRSRIGSLQNELFAEQATLAGSLQRSEYWLGGVITLMILSATAYGRLIARQVQLVGRQKEVYRQELERRVVERTADLEAVSRARADLLKQLLSAQEDERRRIARDLHDSIGQSLTYLIVTLKSMEAEVDGPVAHAAARLRQLAEQSLQEARSLARGLRPTVLDDLGLEPALERLIAESAESSRMQASFEYDSPSGARLPEPVETALYRIVQEALTNVMKYAAAKRVLVRIRQSADVIEALVQDDGRGFIVKRAGAATVGLGSIRERAALLGGTAEITSSPGGGTSVLVRIPAARLAPNVDGD